MNNLLNTVEDKFLFIENINNFDKTRLTAKLELCIIKTDFSDLTQIKNFIKNYKWFEIWLTSENFTTENVFQANALNIKNIVSYPFKEQSVLDYFKSEEKISPIIEKFNLKFLKNKRILLLDDNILNIELLEETLSPLNIEINSFISPHEAIENLRIKKYDLFLLDVMIPEISGFDVAQVIKNTEFNKDTPIVFISALSDAENKIKGYNLGSVAYIEKPFDINVVLSQIYNILKNKSIQDSINDMQETFLAMTTHDLKTPITAEIKAIELLLKNKDIEQGSIEGELLFGMLNTSKYMKILVENILLKYKSEKNTFKLHKEHHSLESIIKECLEENKFLFEEKGFKAKFNNKVKKSFCTFDSVEIKRTITNLLSNAHQYAKPETNIIIELKETDTNFVIEVINYCDKTISENLYPQLFDKFVQYHKNSKTINTGLGLYICKKIVELHGGEIFYAPLSKTRHKFGFNLPKTIPPK